MHVAARAITGAAILTLAVSLPAPASAEPGPEPEVKRLEIVECTMQRTVRKQDEKEHSRGGVLGWLYRYTRNIDIERVGSLPLPGFLRSPLLGSLPGRTEDCDPARLLDAATDCAVVSLDPGAEHSRTVTVPLPQMGVTTPSGLAERIHERLAIGEWVSLRTTREKTIRFDREHVRYVEAEACRRDA
jgi:hypothetical protein